MAEIARRDGIELGQMSIRRKPTKKINNNPPIHSIVSSSFDAGLLSKHMMQREMVWDGFRKFHPKMQSTELFYSSWVKFAELVRCSQTLSNLQTFVVTCRW